MPDLPTLDVVGISKLFGIILASLVVVWGANKAVLMIKSSS